MGAGCWYTLEEDRDIKAYWVDVEPCDTDEGEIFEDYFENVLECLTETILELPICKKYGMVSSVNGGYYKNKIYYGDSFIVSLDSTYHGDGIVINFEFQETEYYSLQQANYEKSYRKLIKHINESFTLSIATSGYTSAEIKINEAYK